MTAAAELIALAERVEGLTGATLWRTRRIGAYTLFAVCAFCVSLTLQIGIGLVVGVRPEKWPFNLDGLLNAVVFSLVFLTLRDMTRNPFDITAAALRARAAELSEGKA